MRKIEVLGIPLQDLTLRESMKEVERFFSDGKGSTIALITMKGLIAAQDSPQIKNWMSSLDMTVAADADILHAADINWHSRIHDVENNAFISEFLRKIVRQRKKIYLISQTTAALDNLERELRSYEENLRIVGRVALEEREYADDDFVINDMNMKFPDVLISNLESPRREIFWEENHMKMNVSIWLMLRWDRQLLVKDKGPIRHLYDRMMKKWFHMRLDRYRLQVESEQLQKQTQNEPNKQEK